MMKIPKSVAYLVLVVLLVTGVYMVYIADGIGPILPSMDQNPVDAQPLPDGEEGEDGVDLETIGGEPIDWDLAGGSEFFVEFRLERERVRSRELDVLQQMINNPNITAETKSEAEKKLLSLQGVMEMELLVENAVKSQGFKNAILIMQEEGALIIVDAEELNSQQILLIAQIASQSTGFRASQINISSQGGK